MGLLSMAQWWSDSIELFFLWSRMQAYVAWGQPVFRDIPVGHHIQTIHTCHILLRECNVSMTLLWMSFSQTAIEGDPITRFLFYMVICQCSICTAVVRPNMQRVLSQYLANVATTSPQLPDTAACKYRTSPMHYESSALTFRPFIYFIYFF